MTWRYWDISVALRDGMACWPGDPAPQVEQVAFMDQGSVCNVTKLHMSAHTATHMDAPRHFINAGAGIDQMPLDSVIGPARVVEIHDPVAIRRAELEKLDLKSGERILFKTRNSSVAWEQPEFFQGLRLYSGRRSAVSGGAGSEDCWSGLPVDWRLLSRHGGDACDDTGGGHCRDRGAGFERSGSGRLRTDLSAAKDCGCRWGTRSCRIEKTSLSDFAVAVDAVAHGGRFLLLVGLDL